MKQKQMFARPALGLLMAAAALSATPLLAQLETVPTPPPIDVVPAPVATPTPVVVTTPPPAATTPTPVRVAPPPAAVVTEPAAEAAPPRRAARSTTQRTVTRTRTATPVRQAAPVASAPIAEAPLAAVPPVTEVPVETLPVETLPVETVPPAAEPVNDRALWPFVALGAALLVAILALFAWRRRRRAAVYDEVYDEPAYREEVIEPAPAAFVATPAMGETVAADTAGEPELEFMLKPSRAGVGDEDARVDFDLEIANRGTAAARDVRVSAWMLGAGSPRQSQAESMLIERVDIEAGEDANVEASVALPRAGLTDAILPVVVAEARYLRPDGSEGRATASYAVGVPDGDGQEMIHFDVENPSGMHDGVVARELDELERA